MRPRRSPSLQASVTAEIAPLPTSAGPSEGTVATPNVNPQWVSEGDPFWTDNNWNKQSVAKVVRDAESVEIFVSAANEKLGSLITRAQRRGVSAVDAIKDFYLEHIAFHAFLESTAQEATTATQESDDENGGAKPERNSELARACETICGIAEATFDVLVTGAVDPTSQTSQDAPSSEPTGAVSA